MMRTLPLLSLSIILASCSTTIVDPPPSMIVPGKGSRFVTEHFVDGKSVEIQIDSFVMGPVDTIGKGNVTVVHSTAGGRTRPVFFIYETNGDITGLQAFGKWVRMPFGSKGSESVILVDSTINGRKQKRTMVLTYVADSTIATAFGSMRCQLVRMDQVIEEDGKIDTDTRTFYFAPQIGYMVLIQVENPTVSSDEWRLKEFILK